MKRLGAGAVVSLLLLAGLLTAASGAAQPAEAGAPEAPSAEVLGKVVATMKGAVESSPTSRLEAARLRGEVAEIRSRTGAGTPVLSWQQEGIGSGLSDRGNAARYLRLTLPFQPPWNRRAIRSLEGTTEDLLEVGRRVRELDVAVLAAEGWLGLAAQVDRVALVEERVGRLRRALDLQTRRYELGEISGSQRRQLELELARERISFRLAERDLFTARQRLEGMVQGGFPRPVAGDLQRMVEALTAPLPSAETLGALLSGSPHLQLSGVRRGMAEVQNKILRRNVWGDPEVELEWERIPALDGAPGIDAAGFRIGLPLPLGRRGRQRLAAAEQELAAETARLDRLSLELEARMRAAVDTVRLGRAGLRDLREAAAQIPQAEHSLEEQFRLGAISYVVFLDGLARLDELRQGLIESSYTVLAAQLEIARLSGSDDLFPVPVEKGDRK